METLWKYYAGMAVGFIGGALCSLLYLEWRLQRERIRLEKEIAWASWQKGFTVDSQKSKPCEEANHACGSVKESDTLTWDDQLQEDTANYNAMIGRSLKR